MKKIGIHFGMNRVNPDSYDGWPGTLAGCIRDATAMAATFAQLGFDTEGHFDEDCTLANVRKKLTDAAAELVAGDTLVFSNSGHGGQSESWRNLTESLCLFDGLLLDTELRDILCQFAPGVNVVLPMDSCHSGGLDRDFTFARARVAPLWVTRKAASPEKERSYGEPEANVMLIAACQANEVALDGDNNGAFTGSLLLSRSEGQSWRQWFDATVRYMSREFPTQHPALIQVSGQAFDSALTSA